MEWTAADAYGNRELQGMPEELIGGWVLQILGWLMYRSGLVPPRLAMFGLVGGPLIIISGALVILDVIEAGGAAQALMTIPEFIWELSIGIYLIVKGYGLRRRS